MSDKWTTVVEAPVSIESEDEDAMFPGTCEDLRGMRNSTQPVYHPRVQDQEIGRFPFRIRRFLGCLAGRVWGGQVRCDKSYTVLRVGRYPENKKSKSL